MYTIIYYKSCYEIIINKANVLIWNNFNMLGLGNQTYRRKRES